MTRQHIGSAAGSTCSTARSATPTLATDSNALEAIRFSTIYFDEAQQLKSAATKRAAAARRIKASRCVMMSGAPLENHLHELWNLIDMSMPGLLGTAKEFGAVYRDPIERGDEAAKRQLVARISPFVLRRTKDQVATDLPPKTEVTVWLELSGAQRDFYNGLAASVSSEVRGLLATERSRANVKILQALVRLQQAAAHPPLVNLPGAKEVGEGVKMSNLMPMLRELKEDGRKVLVYSRWRSILDVLEKHLTSSHRIVRIDGQTRDRATPVERFQNGQADIFLLTFGAGGVGLNLTAADVVVIHDPWWNPAVEDQAADRAHRIGQTKPVFVYRLIVKGTIEEKVLEIREAKSDLAGAIFGDEALYGAQIAPEQLDYLTAPIAADDEFNADEPAPLAPPQAHYVPPPPPRLEALHGPVADALWKIASNIQPSRDAGVLLSRLAIRQPAATIAEIAEREKLKPARVKHLLNRSWGALRSLRFKYAQTSNWRLIEAAAAQDSGPSGERARLILQILAAGGESE